MSRVRCRLRFFNTTGPCFPQDHYDGREQQVAVELKVWRDKRRDPPGEGLKQLDGYLGPLSLDNGWLVRFDQRSSAGETWDRTAFEDAVAASGWAVMVLRA